MCVLCVCVCVWLCVCTCVCVRVQWQYKSRSVVSAVVLLASMLTSCVLVSVEMGHRSSALMTISESVGLSVCLSVCHSESLCVTISSSAYDISLCL